MSYWPIKCLPNKGNNDRWPGKKILLTQNFTKGSRGYPLCLSLCVSENDLGDVWASHEGVWIAAVVQYPTLPSRTHQHWLLGEMRSGSATGERYVLSFPVNGEILYPLPTENLLENATEWIAIAVLFETGSHVTANSIQLRITAPCPYCLCLTCARNTAMHHHAPCMWYRYFVYTRQALFK